MKMLSMFLSPSWLLAALVVLVLASAADAGIFRKRKCGGAGPPASSCSTGGCASNYTTGSAGVAGSNCPGGVCPIQR